jgi:RNA polymerase-binding transcription factor DksA
MLSKEKTDGYKGRLEKELKVILVWLEENKCFNGEGFERVQVPVERENHVKRCKDKKDRVEEIKNTLEKIEKGVFGICIEEKCGREIETERLDFNPTIKRCARCQIEHMVGKKNGN